MRNRGCRTGVFESTHCNNEGVAESGGRISELIRKLNVVLVQPTTWNVSDSIKSSHAGLREEACKEVASNTANAVSGEDLAPT